MTKFESTIKQIQAPQQKVYDMLSDLNNLERVKDRLPEDKLKDLAFDRDSVSVNVAPVGNLTLRVVNREEPKTIKFETEQSPIPFNFWIQLVAMDEENCKMKLTVKADLNPFIKGVVSGPLQEGLEKIADALTMIDYE